ncbi:hypothetical protein [Leuconostoc falkenbergense]|uniref:hypothetical protein n=1 Tax=Leuconostoc falkenbergense TaxID=2766470 RepID=UPI00293C9468|nr:hypothetical protein [Leuconostoc falkenbergense]MDV3544877.1 hypothetical protein [Leuconostoc falkenbergense]
MRLDFLELLTLILIIMKLFGIIVCSWWIVFAPMILVYGVGLIIIAAVLMIGDD